MSVTKSIEDLALAVLRDEGEDKSQENLAAGVILLKNSKEARIEFSTICQNLVNTPSTVKSFEKVLFLHVNAILAEAKSVISENESHQPTEEISIFCQSTCVLISKVSADNNHGDLIKRAITFFKKSTGNDHSIIHLISNCFLDTARLPPQTESKILFIPALILALKIQRIASQVNDTKSFREINHSEDNRVNFRQDLMDLLGRRLFPQGSNAVALSRTEVALAKPLIEDLTKEEFDNYIVRSLKVKIIKAPEEILVTLSALIEILSNIGNGDYFSSHLEGNTKLVQTIISNFLISDDEDIRKDGSILMIELAKACPLIGISSVSQAMADALNHQPCAVEGLCMGLEIVADYILEMKENDQGMLSWDILAKKHVLPAMGKIDEELCETALSKWQRISASTTTIITTPGAISSPSSVSKESALTIVACYEESAMAAGLEKKTVLKGEQITKTAYSQSSSGKSKSPIIDVENGILTNNSWDSQEKLELKPPDSPVSPDATDDDIGGSNTLPPFELRGLTVAVQINGEGDSDGSGALQEAQKYDPKRSKFKNVGRFQILVAVVVTAIIIVAVTLIVIFSIKKGVEVTTVVPTMQPTSMSYSLMKQKLEKMSLTKETTFDSPGTTYFKAFQWMLSDQISVEALMYNPNDDVLRERFALSHLYFSLTEDSIWTFCSHFFEGMAMNDGETDSRCDYFPPLESEGSAFMNKAYNTRWLSNTDVCLWGGIYCHNETVISDSFVGAIEVYNNNLQGTISEEIGLLWSLNLLSIMGNKIYGTIPTEIGLFSDFFSFRANANNLRDDLSKFYQFPSLVTLEIGSNRFYGSIGTEIGRLRQLRGLWLNNNTFTGTLPTEIGHLSRLDFFSTQDNPTMHGTLPSEVGKMISLDELRLTDNGLNGTIPSEIGNLNDIQTLILHKNRFSGTIPESMYDLTTLQKLYLGMNQLNGTIGHGIGKLSLIEILQVHTNKLTGEIPSEIGLLFRLKHAQFHRNYLNGTMPDEVCSNRNKFVFLESLSTDCFDVNGTKEIECQCCTHCCDPDDICYRND